MSDIQTLDVRGLSCPEPALRTRQALTALGQGTLVVLVDGTTSQNNVERTGRQLGWQASVSVSEDDDAIRITLEK